MIAEVDQIVDDICDGATNSGTNMMSETNNEDVAKRSSCSITENEEASGNKMDESPLKKLKVDEKETTEITSLDDALISV